MARRQHIVEQDAHWHLDKKVPLALIFTMLVQAAALVAWASSVTADIGTLTRDVAVLTSDNKERGVKMEEVISLKVEVRHINDSIARIEKTLGQVLSFGRAEEETPYVRTRPRAAAR
jgi:hypothetical protein